MRPMFAATIVTDAGTDLEHPDTANRSGSEARRDRSEAYREWRRTRVLFMRSESAAERAVVHRVADLPAQCRRADL